MINSIEYVDLWINIWTQVISLKRSQVIFAVSQNLRKVTPAINNRALPCSRSNNLSHGFNKQFIFFAEKHKWASTRVHKKTYFACAIPFWIHIKSSRNSFNLSRIPVPLQLVQDIPSLVFDKILLWNSNPFEPKNVTLIFFFPSKIRFLARPPGRWVRGVREGQVGIVSSVTPTAPPTLCSPLWKYSALEISTTGKTYNSLQ